MSRKIMDLTGKKFHKLLVIRLSDTRNKQGKPQWVCKCDCGSEKKVVVTTNNLTAGNVKSCGCLRKNQVKKHYLEEGVAAFNALFTQYKRRAKKNKLSFTLTKGEFLNITQQPCFYCGVLPKQRNKCPGYNGDFIYNGIDRVDNKLGYTKENSVPCCGTCNMMKNTLPYNKFIEHIKKILNNISIRNNTNDC